MGPPLHIDLDLTWTSEDGPDEGLVMATLRATWDPFYNPEGWCDSWDSTYSKLHARATRGYTVTRVCTH